MNRAPSPTIVDVATTSPRYYPEDSPLHRPKRPSMSPVIIVVNVSSSLCAIRVSNVYICTVLCENITDDFP